MDAISFVLGERTPNLRVKKLAVRKKFYKKIQIRI